MLTDTCSRFCSWPGHEFVLQGVGPVYWVGYYGEPCKTSFPLFTACARLGLTTVDCILVPWN
jgi:hypothetical protein